MDRKDDNIEEKIKAIQQEISRYEKLLKDKFNLDKQLEEAEKYINYKMKEIGNKLDFESSYKPINLKFSLTNFDLWHEKENKDKVYLRSMGSGANWLYSHITLFLALHNFFCSLGNKSIVPPILFLDQPSQVYFPTSIKDENDEFNIDNIEEKKGTNTKDEDLKAVTNLFNQLVSFCATTLKETGIEPQIIITDHADNLELDNGVSFESLVNGRRWRTRGFINDK